MLVLSRKTDEQIVIGGGIRLKVLEIRGNRVRFGIEAPHDVSILRQELVDACPEKFANKASGSLIPLGRVLENAT